VVVRRKEMDKNSYIRIPCPTCGHQLATIGSMRKGYECIHCGKGFKSWDIVSKYYSKYIADYKKKEKHYDHPVQYQLEMLIKATMELREHLMQEKLYTDWVQVEMDDMVTHVKKVDAVVTERIKEK
jgi:hypothetical protein